MVPNCPFEGETLTHSQLRVKLHFFSNTITLEMTKSKKLPFFLLINNFNRFNIHFYKKHLNTENESNPPYTIRTYNTPRQTHERGGVFFPNFLELLIGNNNPSVKQFLKVL